MIRSIFDPIYGANEVGSAQAIHPHKLSVFFIVLASGTLDDNPAFASGLAQQYYVLARAAFSMKAIAGEANIATVQAIFMVIWFLHISDHENTSEERWLLAGICFKTAHIVGTSRLHLINPNNDLGRSDCVNASAFRLKGQSVISYYRQGQCGLEDGRR